MLEHVGTGNWRGAGLAWLQSLEVKETHDGRQPGNFVICGEGRRKDKEKEEEEECAESVRCCLLALPCLSRGKVIYELHPDSVYFHRRQRTHNLHCST